MNTLKISALRLAVASLLALGLVNGAEASTFILGKLQAGTGAPDSPEFGTLEVTESGADVLFALSAPGLDQFQGSAFVATMAVDGTKTGSVANVSGGVSVVGMKNGGGPSGAYDFAFSFGKGNDRFVDGETVNWRWVGGAGKYTNFAVHVQGLTYPGAASAWYIPIISNNNNGGSGPNSGGNGAGGGTVVAVPEPSVYAMLLLGAGAIGWRQRRQRAKSVAA